MDKPNSSLKGTEGLTGKQLDNAMAEMECWSVDNHLAKCNKHNLSLQEVEKKMRGEIIEKIEIGFDDFRSSSQKVKGKRRFGVANFKVGARDLHDDILSSLKKEK